jgi:hypothetical protein
MSTNLAEATNNSLNKSVALVEPRKTAHGLPARVVHLACLSCKGPLERSPNQTTRMLEKSVHNQQASFGRRHTGPLLPSSVTQRTEQALLPRFRPGNSAPRPNLNFRPTAKPPRRTPSDVSGLSQIERPRKHFTDQSKVCGRGIHAEYVQESRRRNASKVILVELWILIHQGPKKPQQLHKNSPSSLRCHRSGS